MEALHLIKLCVGIDSLAHLRAWRTENDTHQGETHTRHITRMWPKRAPELLQGGSLFWVIRGVISCRQRILRFDEITGPDGIRRCGIIMAPEIIETLPAQRRAFQGWRYLAGTDAPADAPATRTDEEPLPAALSAALSEIGLR